MKFPKSISMSVSHNDCTLCYQKVKDAVEEREHGTDPGCFETEAEMDKAIETNSVWVMQWYPRTPVGFYIVAAATFEECVAYALRAERGYTGG